MSEIKISRDDKIKAIGFENNYTKSQLSDEALDEIYYKFANKNKTSSCYTKKSDYKKVDANSDKYKIVMLFLNDILEILGKNKISDITEFKDIKRSDLIKPECKLILNKYLDKFVEQFTKTKLNYSQRNDIETYILTIIRKIVIMCGYDLQSKSNQKRIIKNGTIIKTDNWITYTII